MLAEAGADFALNALTPTKVESTAAEIAKASGRRVVPVVADGKADEVGRAVNSVLRDLRAYRRAGECAWGLDPQTAGGAAGRDGRRRGVADDELRFIIDVNLTEALLCTRAVGPHMLERGSGKVINIGSWTAHQGGRDMVLYTTAKIALAGFSGRRRSNGRPTGCTSMRLRRAFSWTS